MTEPTVTRVKLSTNHRRSISASLHLTDKALCTWDAWATGDVPAGVMYQQRDTLSAVQKRELRTKIKQARELIVRLRDDLQLQPSTPTTPQLLAGQATVLWEMLCDLNSRSLRGYGNVPDDLARYLDPIAEKLLAEMNKISGLFSQSSPSAGR